MKMTFFVLLSRCYMASTLVMFALILGADTCNTNWIRLVYVMSCGKKKRENTASNGTMSGYQDVVPLNLEDAIRYYQERNPKHPMFQDNNRQLKELLGMEATLDEKKFRDPRLYRMEVERKFKKNNKEYRDPTTAKKFLPPQDTGFGIPGFFDEWDIEEELSDGKIHLNQRREIDSLIAKCCKVSAIPSECNAAAFEGACK